MTAIAIQPRSTWRLSTVSIGLGVLSGFVLVAVFSSVLSPYRPAAPVGAPLSPPSAQHLLGTNAIGQDLASQMLSGTRTSLAIAVMAGLGTLVIGAAVGVAAGFVGGLVERALMRVTDLMFALPRLPLLIVVGAYVGTTLASIAAIIAVTSWPGTARMIRAQVKSLRNRAHVRASMGFGSSTVQVLRRHIIPELGLILVAGLVSAVGRAVMMEAGLAFLGLGDLTRFSWGRILRDALDFGGLFFTPAWKWWLVPPILAISVLLLTVTWLGTTIEERINPRVARHVVDRR